MPEERYYLGEPISVRELAEIVSEGQRIFTTKEKESMPPQQAKPSNFSKYAKRSAGIVSEAMGAPLKLGNARLPAGIDRGIARLDNCRIAEIKEGTHKGNLGFYADGLVVQPTHFQGENLAHMRTSLITIPLCDKDDQVKPGEPGSWESQWKDKVIPQLRGLCGLVGEELVRQIDPDNTGDPDTMIANAKKLCQRLQNEIKPYFRFRTWKGNPQVIAQNQKDGMWYVWTTDKDDPKKRPIDIAEYKGKKRGPYQTENDARMKNKNLNSDFVNEQWLGACPPPDEMSEPTDGAGTEDNTGTPTPPPMKGENNGPPPPPPKKGGTTSRSGTMNRLPPVEGVTPPPDDDQSSAEPHENDDPTGGSDLDNLVLQCEDTSDPEVCEDARSRLLEIALKVGMTDDDCTNAPSFQEIVDEIRRRINESQVPGTPDESEPPPPADVSVKQVYKYLAPGTKRAVQVQVTAVSKKETPWRVNLLSLADNKTVFKRVSVDDLLPVGRG